MPNDKKISSLLKDVGALYDISTTTQNLDPWNNMVQFEDDANRVASGDTTIAFSGPPVFKKPGGTADTFASYLVPIGALQGFSESSTNGVAPFPEIGSRLKRAARGQASYQLSIQRVLSWHSNILHACYAWLDKVPGIDKTVDMHRAPGELQRPGNLGSGSSPHLTTFESELFGVPFGMLLAVVSADGTVISQEYFERAYIMNHGKQVGAGQPMIQESVSIFASRKVPADDLVLNLTGAQASYTFPTEPTNT